MSTDEVEEDLQEFEALPDGGRSHVYVDWAPSFARELERRGVGFTHGEAEPPHEGTGDDAPCVVFTRRRSP